MRNWPWSSAATQLRRGLLVHSGLGKDRISIGHSRSIDWQSLTFVGERHEISLRLTSLDAQAALTQLRNRLATLEWRLNGHVVVDILIVGTTEASDGSILVAIEALTLTD